MAIIEVGFSKHKGFAPVSWLIMLCEDTPFSHAFIRVRSETLGRNLIYQATGSGVNFVGDQVFDEGNQVVETYQIQVSDSAKVKLLQWAVDQAGKPYGHLELVGLGLIRLLKLFGVRITNPFGSGTDGYVCCKLVAAALEELGVSRPEPLDQVDLNVARNMVLEAVNEKGKT